jgi:AcrR family transcriptional regulator
VSATRPRMAASERRAALLETACRVFSKGSYRGVTTAEIAREAGVSEPILYRHFASKRALYFACIDEAWRHVRSVWTEASESGQAQDDWFQTVSNAMQAAKAQRVLLASLWVQALAESSEDEEIRKYLRHHLREVHDDLAEGMRRAQEAGQILPDRDPGAEAWMFVGNAIIGSIWQRLGIISDEDVQEIKRSRRRWLSGSD